MTRISPGKQRLFHINNPEHNKDFHFPSNFIKTAKYNALSFLPKTMFLQFLRYANIYFLIIAILQSISIISPLNPFSAIAPFVFVLALSIIREGLEDLTRHRSDKEANARKCIVFKNGAFLEQEWRNLLVGDIVIVKESEFFPADLIVVSSNHLNGLCFIETSSLDGEKNLKPRTAIKETLNLYHLDNLKMDLTGKVECIQSNPMLSSFDGTIIFDDGKKAILNSKQLLYRGAKLKNTAWVIGIAVYTGADTKLMKNSESAKIKQSKIERLTNKLILSILLFQTIVCFAAAIGTFVFNHLYIDGHYYIEEDTSSGLEAFISFWSYFLLNNTMIPISLIVSLEFVKLIQAYFIEKDDELYHKKRQRRATVFSSAINEELGQVEYLFSDKTGTLTCNEMEFKIAVVGNEMYGDTTILENSNHKEAKTLSPQQPGQEDQEAFPSDKNAKSDRDQKESVKLSFADQRLEALMKSKVGDKPVGMTMYTSDKSKMTFQLHNQSELVREYFTALATCHECLVEKQDDGSLTYQGPSPDEITLVDTANRLGYSFIVGSENNKKINVFGQDKEFEVLHSFEFNSDRKRMSVILKDQQGQIKLYIKGADAIIKNRLKHSEKQPFLKYIDQKLEIFARKGLRTLLIGMKVLDSTEYAAFLKKYNSVADSAEKEKDIEKLADEIERDLYLIGATAVEDRLQDNVPETIYDLIKANIKVWMLTGDKLETAENIAKSCNLIQEDFQVFQCSETTKEALQDVLAKHRKYHDYFLEHGIRKALIIEGESLAIVLHDPVLTALFISITKSCEAVVCCRVTPKQKADVVRLVKKNLGKITLAIGDGANDVNMIQEAHIGIGLYGQEGMRAVQASDFALPEFQGLWRLLFVHGRWSYFRIAEMILYFFYKNMIFTIPQFYFAFISAFSAQSIFDDFYITTYNLVFTSLPLVIRAVIDQDINYKERALEDKNIVTVNPIIKKNLPKLYYMGQKNRIFNHRKFLGSIIQGLIHGGFIFAVTFLSLNKTALNSNGKSSDFYYMSITLYTSIIFIVDMKIAVYTKYWTILTPISLVLLSLTLYFAYMFGVDLVTDGMIAQTTQMLFTSCHFYLIVLFNFSIIFLMDLGYLYFKSNYYGELSDYFQKLIKENKHQNEKAFKKLFNSKTLEKEIEIQPIDITDGEDLKRKIKHPEMITSPKGMNKSHQQMESVDYLLKGPENDGENRIGSYNLSPKGDGVHQGQGSLVLTEKASEEKRRRNKPVSMQPSKVGLKPY